MGSESDRQVLSTEGTLERTVTMTPGARGTVSLHRPVLRYPANPLLAPDDVNREWQDPGLQVVTVHNAGAAMIGGRTALLFRSHLRCGISVLGAARSVDGVTGWQVDHQPALLPATPNDRYAAEADIAAIVDMESGGVEDPRLNPIDGTLAVTYSAYDARVKDRVQVALATTDDLASFVRHGPMVEGDMRNVVIFPERVGGRFVGLFRPNDQLPGDVGGTFAEIRVGHTDDVRSGRWQLDDRPIMRTGAGPSAFSDKIGPGAPPVRTRHGWLNLFHGARATMDGNPYVLGVALHDLDNVRRVRMSAVPVLFPSPADCRVPEDAYVHVPNVVFSCGMLRRGDGTLVIYYGGNDTVLNVGFSHEDVLAELCTSYGQDPLTGELLYSLRSPSMTSRRRR
jgi:predicted GH43/DUF377 family glycosyl hydrolase